MKKRILVVEDEEKLRRVIELQLVSGGFDVDKAATPKRRSKWSIARPGAHRLAAAFHGRPGISRRHPPPERTRPVIMMTAFGSVEPRWKP